MYIRKYINSEYLVIRSCIVSLFRHVNLILWKEKMHFRRELAYIFRDWGEAELILRIWGAKENTFRELRHFGRSVHNFQGSREHRPPGGLNTI